jgi:hypothetical protein
MESARISHAAAFAVKETGRLVRSTAFWCLELLALAMSYGLLFTSWAASALRSDLARVGLLKDIKTASIWFAAVALMSFMNFIRSGYIVTSLIARFFCVSKLPRIYPFVLSCLVVVHIWIIRLMDHGDWGLTINFPLFVGWGAASAFVIAWYSVKLQNFPGWGARNKG